MNGYEGSLTIGAAQLSEVYFDREATIDKDCEYIGEAGERGIDLLVFPEFHVPASPHWYRFDDGFASFKEFYRRLFEEAVEVPGRAVSRLAEAAGEAGVTVVMGVTEREPERSGSMYNTQIVIDAAGELVGSRRKLVPTIHERIFHTGGTGQDVTTFETTAGTVGAMMCGEHYNQLASFAINAHGEDVHAAGWPAMGWYDQEQRDSTINVPVRNHALVGNVPVASATGAIDEDLAEAAGLPSGWIGDSGTSAIIGPDGNYLAGPKWGGEGIVSVDVDLGDRLQSKSVSDVLGHYNRFDVFTLQVDKTSHDRLVTKGDPEGAPVNVHSANGETPVPRSADDESDEEGTRRPTVEHDDTVSG